MSKNLTRKGLALGAAVALGSTLFAGAPAFAANEVVLAPTAGTTYGMISGEIFSLTSTVGATISSAAYDDVAYEITNAAGLNLTVNGTGLLAADVSAFIATATTAQVVRADASHNTANTVLTLDVAATDEGSVTVKSWIDSDADKVIDSTEFVSDLRTVSFKKLANVTFTTVLTQPVLGDSKLAATLALSGDVNADQVDGAIKIGFASKASTYTAAGAGTTVDGAGAFTNGVSSVYVDSSNLKAEVAVSPAATTYYVAQALFTPTGGSIAEKGDESVKATAAATISSLDKLKATVSADVAVDSSTSAMTVRNGTASVKLSAQAYSTGTTKAAAGQTVKVTITEGSATGNTDAATFTAGGKTLKDTTSAADKIEFDVVTDADGKVSFDLAIAGTVAGTDDITVALSAQGQSSSNTISFDDATVAAGALVNSSVVGASALQKIAAGASYTLKYTAKDSLGKGLGSEFRVLLTETGANPDVAREATFANGVVTFALTDSTSVTESYTAQLQKWNKITLVWENVTSNLISAHAPTVGTSAAVDKVATLVGTATTGLALNLNELKAADTRVGDAAPTVTSSASVATLSGTVVDALAVGTYSDVTLSGTGVMFEANGVYTVGSITVQSDANGAFGGVKVYSNTAGDTVITATAAGKTKTLTLTFASAAAGTGSTYVIDAPATIAPGKTLTMNVVVKDKYGNKVADAIEFTYAGPGLPLSSTTPTAANTEYKVLLGAADAATATVTVKIDKNADGDKTDDGETLTASIAIAAPVVVVPEVKTTIVGVTKAVRIRVENAKGEEVEVKFGSKTVAVAIAGTNSKLWVLKTTKGKKSVKVYVDGDLVAVKTVTVK